MRGCAEIALVWVGETAWLWSVVAGWFSCLGRRATGKRTVSRGERGWSCGNGAAEMEGGDTVWRTRRGGLDLLGSMERERSKERESEGGKGRRGRK